MYDDEDSFFRRPEIIGVLGASVVIFLGVILFVLFHASAPTTPTNAAATHPATSTTSTTMADDSNANSPTFSVTYNAQQYTCWNDATLAEDYFYDCSLGSSAQTADVALYCDGDKKGPTCSTNWYPSKLQNYDVRTINNAQYLCSTATGSDATKGDKLCAKYSGGDPTQVSAVNQLKCSTVDQTLTCNAKYFPSELDDLTIIKVEGQQYVCEETTDGSQCYRWNGNSSPKQASQGEPDMYCDKNNDCQVP